MQTRLIGLCTLIAGLAGCASYTPLPLPQRPDLPSAVSRLTVPAGDMRVPGLGHHTFDPSDGLDMTEVAMLAVANNPGLKVARDESGVAGAQAFAAGLLPDPRLSLSQDFPGNGNATTSAFGLGVSYDLNALMTRSTAKAAAEANHRQVDLNLLWQEWQVAARARMLFVRDLEHGRQMALLREEQALLAKQYGDLHNAMMSGNSALPAASTALAALQGVETRISDLERKIIADRQALNGILGLAPDTKLDLVGDADIPPLDIAAIYGDLDRLAKRRPDLLALQAGYSSQDLRFRQAILAQFPAINVGLTRARDTSGIYTRGFGVTISLPLFNGNRGNVAIEKATRQRLHDDYRMRLNEAAAQVKSIVADQALLEKQRETTRETAQEMEKMAAAAAQAYKAGNMDTLSYTSFREAWLAKRMESIALDQILLTQRVALQTLLGADLTPAGFRSARP